jgi:hypothetical protein
MLGLAPILSAKCLKDVSPPNHHWACAITLRQSIFGFSVEDINAMDNHIIRLLDWKLQITQDLNAVAQPFLPLSQSLYGELIRSVGLGPIFNYPCMQFQDSFPWLLSRGQSQSRSAQEIYNPFPHGCQHGSQFCSVHSDRDPKYQ